MYRRNTKDSAKSFFTICPKPHGSQCKGTYATANRLLYPKLSPKGMLNCLIVTYMYISCTL